LPDAWLRWGLFERRPLMNFAQGPAALLGDAAHPMLPFLAQGGAMAIEDAVVAAQCLARRPDDAAAALQTYSAIRCGRTRRAQRQAARNGLYYHFKGASAMLRDAAMGVMGGRHLLGHYDWLYDWRPPTALSVT
jgi:salicylate hydroxylase